METDTSMEKHGQCLDVDEDMNTDMENSMNIGISRKYVCHDIVIINFRVITTPRIMCTYAK
jgi:hypothetical protein